MRISEIYAYYLQSGEESIDSPSYNVISEVVDRSIRALFLTVILLIVTAIFLVGFLSTMNISIGFLLVIGIFCTVSSYSSYIKLVIEYEKLMLKRVEVIQKLEEWRVENVESNGK